MIVGILESETIELARIVLLRDGDEDLERAPQLFENCGALGDLAKP
jgi:hypothetical protein